MFSIAPIFMARLSKEIGQQLGVGASEWLALAYELEKKGAVQLAATATEGNWMWLCARGIEKGDPPSIYAFATRKQGQWLFDMHVGKEFRVPCFGADVPNIFIPMSAVFEKVYSGCKQLLNEGSKFGGQS